MFLWPLMFFLCSHWGFMTWIKTIILLFKSSILFCRSTCTRQTILEKCKMAAQNDDGCTRQKQSFQFISVMNRFIIFIGNFMWDGKIFINYISMFSGVGLLMLMGTSGVFSYLLYHCWYAITSNSNFIRLSSWIKKCTKLCMAFTVVLIFLTLLSAWSALHDTLSRVSGGWEPYLANW